MTPDNMKDEEVIADFMGFICKQCLNSGVYHTPSKRRPGALIEVKCSHPYLPAYAESLDAIRPVLLKFTPEMRDIFYAKLWQACDRESLFELLIAPAELLAALAAEVIRETKEKR